MNDKKKTILFVMPRLPFPASSGRKTSLYHYCRIISEELGYRLVVAAFLEQGDNPNNKPEFIDRLEVLPKAPLKKRLSWIMIDSIILRRRPMQVSLYWSKEAKRIIDRIIEIEKPAIVIGDMVRSTEYIRNCATYKISDLDDRISLRYKRQLEVGIKGINPYGAFINSIPYPIKKIMLLGSIKKLVVKNEIRLLSKYELLMGKECDCTVFVAANEADEFNNEIGAKKAIAIPIGVDTDFFSYRETGINENYIGFLGAMNVAHNENAAIYFINKIFPFILQKFPDAKFLIIGGGVSKELKKMESDHVIFTGRVNDVRDYLQKCKMFVCPMTFGSGIKTKNLEAMALGLPVVTTSIGAENINAVPNRDWLVEDKPEKFADAVCKLLADEKYRRDIGKAGSEFITNNFTWKVAMSVWKGILNKNEV